MKRNFLEKITENTTRIIGRELLEKKIQENTTLRVKLGADPTAPHLHLGHVIVLEKLRLFQEEGHHIQFLIGDYTARIGDPTGKSKTRPILTEEAIAHNVATYKEQIKKVITKGTIEVVYNSEWLSRVSFSDWLVLNAKVTVAQLVERDDFSQRLSQKVPVFMHELMYPLMQGYDSVVLKSDVEIGGNDQLFNMIMGRHLQEQYGQEPQAVITLPLLRGLDGHMKMSKSLKNEVGLLDTPEDAFGKLMTVRDEHMGEYLQYILHKTPAEVALLFKECHPMEIKKNLSYEILQRYWGEEAAKTARAYFEDMFQKKEYHEAKTLRCVPQELSIIQLVQQALPHLSRTKIKVLIEEGGVSINGEKNTNITTKYLPIAGDVIKMGKNVIVKISLC